VTTPDGSRDGSRPPRPHHLDQAASLGRKYQPSLVLTAAETLAIRYDAIPGHASSPQRRPARIQIRPLETTPKGDDQSWQTN
jgi:hypothetical protein